MFIDTKLWSYGRTGLEEHYVMYKPKHKTATMNGKE